MSQRVLPDNAEFEGVPLAYFWLWSICTGLLAAGVTVGFRLLIDGGEWLITSQRDGLVAGAAALPPPLRIFIGAAGGAFAGVVLWFGTRWAAAGPRGAQHIDYIDAARVGHGELNDRTTLARSASSLISVVSGASVGREGPMVQLAAWAAVLLGRRVRLSNEQRNALLVCGIAAGIGSAYHAPIAGVVFVLELALGFLASHTVAPVLIAVASSSIVIRSLGLSTPLYVMPAIAPDPGNLVFAAFIGLACGGLGTLLLYSVARCRLLFSRIDLVPARLALGGLIVGSLAALTPEVWGNGFSTVSRVLQGDVVLQWVALVLLVKLSATVFSAGSGAIGGLFTPTLFIGATGGYLLGAGALDVLPAGWVGTPSGVAVIGMAAALAAATQAPLMAIVMVLEMTGQFQLSVPVMLATGIAYVVGTRAGSMPLYGNPIEGHV
jgi:CIC family chloride channel protein